MTKSNCSKSKKQKKQIRKSQTRKNKRGGLGPLESATIAIGLYAAAAKKKMGRSVRSVYQRP